jgi:ADP-heptose:LPS heptosyltransferase
MEKILVSPLIGMGDTLMTTPALRLIKTNHPDWQVTCFTISSSNHELLKGNPFIDNLWYYPLKSLGFLNGPIHIFKKFSGKYSVSLTFYPSNRAAYNCFALLTGAKKRIGHTYLNRNITQLNWLKNLTIREDPNAHCVEENIRLLSFLGISCDKEAFPAMEIFLTSSEKAKGAAFRNSIDTSKLIGIHAGTSTFKHQDKRRWPKEKFAELINSFPDCHFVLFGTKEEKETNSYIVSNIVDKSHITLINNKPLRETIAIIGACDGFVSNDSGLMHVAAAMKVPVVALLGPTNPAFIYPWKTPHCLVRTGIECSPCYYYSPKPLTCVKNIKFKCISEISVDVAKQALKQLIGV